MLVVPNWMNTGGSPAFSRRVEVYSLTRRSEAPGTVIGKVMSTVFASGRTLNGSGSSELGWNSNCIVEPAPERLVAAQVILDSSHNGIKKVDVQPAPRMRISTDMVVRSVVDFD
jgi:hypothetical protein